MNKKKINFQCLKCYYIFDSTPGIAQCPMCGHYYCQLVEDKKDEKGS